MLKLHTFKYIFIHLIKKMQFPVLYIYTIILMHRDKPDSFMIYDVAEI